MVIGTIVAVVGIFALGGFLLWQQVGLKPFSPTFSPTPTEQQTPPPAPAPSPQSKPEVGYDKNLYKGWGNYTDEENGYSLRIPPQWISKEFIESHADDYYKVAFGLSEGVLMYIGEEEAYKVYSFGCSVVTVTAIPSKFSVEGTISQIMDNRSELDNAARREVFVGSQKAIQFDESIFPFDPRDRNSQLDGLTTFVKHNDNVFMFTGLSCETQKEQFKNFYEMMLESVQFFDIPEKAIERPLVDTDTSTWPLYTHPVLGYSLKMHPDFTASGDAERFLVLTDKNKSCLHSQDIETKKWIAAELDVNIFTYGASNFSTSREESKRLYQKLLDAPANTEVIEEGTIILKIDNFNLDGRLLPQVLVGGNTYVTLYSGDRQAFHFELEGDCPDDIERSRLLLNAAFSTFRFNHFNP